jgi:environmental stress-induced protein Ves
VSLTLLRHDQHRRMPWRNGGGVTAEVARSPEGGSDADFDWRISFAEVSQSGPFSAFPGVDRTILLVSGPGMLLEFPDRSHALRPHEPFRFDGEEAVHCTISGPTRDLNVMTRRVPSAAPSRWCTLRRPTDDEASDRQAVPGWWRSPSSRGHSG